MMIVRLRIQLEISSECIPDEVGVFNTQSYVDIHKLLINGVSRTFTDPGYHGDPKRLRPYNGTVIVLG